MNRYVYDSRGYFVRSINLTKWDSYPPNSTTTAPPGPLARWDNTQWHEVQEVPPAPVRTPHSVEVRRLKLALFDADLLDTVQTYIQGLGVNVRKRILLELDNGGDITQAQAHRLLDDAIGADAVDDMLRAAAAIRDE